MVKVWLGSRVELLGNVVDTFDNVDARNVGTIRRPATR